MLAIEATFIGEDGSMGYRTGRIYSLIVQGCRVDRLENPGTDPCPYASVESFLRNWSEIYLREPV
jgi:hypothetical protein